MKTPLSGCALVAGTLLPLLVGPAGAQATARPGYELVASAPVPFGAVTATFTDGRFLSFDGLAITQHQIDGSMIRQQFALSSFVFPSFIEIDPSEAFAVFGESSTGMIRRLDLVTDAVTDLAQATFNFALAFDADPTKAFVSAALGGWGAGNDLLRLDLSTGAITALAHVSGPSGPICSDPAGNLYYGTQFDGWPAPPDSQNLLRFDAGELLGNSILTELDADLVVAGLDGSSSVAVDPATGSLLVIDSDPNQAGENALLRYSSSGSLLDTVVADAAYISTIEVSAGAGPMVLAPWQPAGARVFVSATDYNISASERLEVAPRRAAITFTGPTTPVQGLATVSVSAGPANGSLVWMWTRPVYLSDPEWNGNLGWGVPTFYMSAPVFLLRQSIPLPLDGNGAATLQYSQPASWFAGAVFQARLYDAGGTPVGTSDLVVND